MFIKLTDTYFNVDRIAQFYIAARNKKTVVCDSNADETFEVDETPDEILALIEAERVKELRDEFAGRIAQGDWASQDISENGVFLPSMDDEALLEYTKFYYRMADAMLKAREVKC